MISMFKNLWRFRFFIVSSIKTEIRTKFAHSKLGSIWVILNPLAQVLMYTIVLSAVLSSKLPGITSRFGYAIYLLSGMLCWSLFTELLTKASTMFIDNSNLIKKIVFPKLALPTILVGTTLVNNIILFISIILVFGILGHPISWKISWIIPLMLITVGTGLGAGLILGVMNVFIRDIGQLIPILLQFSFWFTPIVYPVEVIPEKYRFLLNFNPFYSVVSSYQNVLVLGKNPDAISILIAMVVALILLFTGLFAFKRASSEIVDAL